MLYIDDYCDENFIINYTYVTSPETSIIFSKITDDDIQNFFMEWTKQRKENECIAYDVTSISSYSKQISLLDLGYNRDGENLPQINLGLFYGMDSKLPLLYDIYNGSISDKTHFEAMMAHAKAYDINNVSLIMDRGFFKKDNIEYLYKKQIPFILGISLSILEVQNKIEETKNIISSSKYLLKDNETNGMSKDISIGGLPYKLNIYYNRYKVADENTIIANKIEKYNNELAVGKKIDSSARYEKYFKLTINDGILKSYEKDYDKIDKILSNAGYYALLSSRMDYSTEDILFLYRRKDLIEKTFDNLKNYVDCNRLRVHYNETIKGKVFVTFLSLIMKSVIDDKINNTTVKKIINELKKIKLSILANGEEYIAPLTKKQKDILSIFNIDEKELKEGIR